MDRGIRYDLRGLKPRRRERGRGMRVSVRYRYPTLRPIKAAMIDVGGDETASWYQY
jgi:hypothetical protein